MSDNFPTFTRQGRRFLGTLIDSSQIFAKGSTTVPLGPVLGPSFTNAIEDFRLHISIKNNTTDLGFRLWARYGWEESEMDKSFDIMDMTGSSANFTPYEISILIADHSKFGRFMRFFITVQPKAGSSETEVSGVFSVEIHGTTFGN
jgi:hypothetical protein